MVPTDEGKSQRVRFGVMCACHAVAFALAMAIIGFPEMISEFLLSLLCYSCYLCLREWLQIIYLISLVISTWNTFVHVFSSNEND